MSITVNPSSSVSYFLTTEYLSNNDELSSDEEESDFSLVQKTENLLSSDELSSDEEEIDFSAIQKEFREALEKNRKVMDGLKEVELSFNRIERSLRQLCVESNMPWEQDDMIASKASEVYGKLLQ